MAWVSPRTWVASAILTAAQLNTDVRDNLNYLKGLLDGTGSDAVTVPGVLNIMADSLFSFQKTSGDPIWVMDANDWLQWQRASNALRLVIGAVEKFAIDGNGKLTGAGFFDSGEVSIAATGYLSVPHGLPARPRFVSAWGGLSSGTANSKTLPFGHSTQIPANELTINDVDATRVYLYNGYGATRYANVYCIL